MDATLWNGISTKVKVFDTIDKKKESIVWQWVALQRAPLITDMSKAHGDLIQVPLKTLFVWSLLPGEIFFCLSFHRKNSFQPR